VKFGISTFFNRSGNPTALGRAVEDRNFDSLFVAEHTHIPVDRRSRYPTGAELPDIYQV
jgi:alkanesulfonate monooxygenase SsuD/methylene tetrahydromethanopterin reductase-like flavin-dependent oxidoreductase (luciferase family)